MADPVPVGLVDAGQAPFGVPTMETRIVNLETDVSLLARALDRGELAESLAVTEQLDRPLTLVVAGETSRGKSSLINALLSRPDLLATSADVTTNVYVSVHGGDEAASVRLASGAVVDIDPADAADWTTVRSTDGERPPIAMAMLAVRSPLLESGLVLVDTPGVGGLDSAHADMTLLAISQADALLFVLDAKAPISGPERSFLVRAAERIETVIVAITKIDLFPGWPTVAAQDREFLDRYVPRFAKAKILPVSSLLAARADGLALEGDVERAALIRQRSGVDVLRGAILDDIVEPGVRLRRSNRLRGSLSVADELRATVAARKVAISGDAGQQAQVDAAKTRLEQYRSAAGSWSIALADDFATLRSDLGRLLSIELMTIENDLAVLNDASQLPAMPDELEARLAGSLIRVNAALGEGVRAVSERLTTTLSVEGIEIRPPVIDPAMPAARLESADRGETETEAVVGIGRLVLGAAGPVMFLNALPTILGSAALAPIVLPLAPVLALIGLAMGVVDRKKILRTSNLNAAQRQWGACLRRTLGPAKIELTTELDQRLLLARRQMEAQVKDAVDRRISYLRNESIRLGVLAHEGAEARTKALDAAESADRALAALVARAAGLRDTDLTRAILEAPSGTLQAGSVGSESGRP